MGLSEDQIRINLQRVMERIQRAASAAHRSPDSVKLLVVSKRQPVDVVINAARAGVALFGENYAEEIEPKRQALSDLSGIEWHMIGHIQSRKVKIVAEMTDYVHSIDSLELGLKLNAALLERKRALPVLLEMNVSSEESKSGWAAWDETRWERLLPDIEGLLACSQLHINGLMTMPPLLENPEAVRPYFARLARLRDFLAAHFPATEWRELSMGTSADFETGIQEGATFIRVGQAILGPRPVRISA